MSHFTYSMPLALCCLLPLAGCSSLPTEQLAVDEDPVITGSNVRRNFTPLEPAFACLANGLRQKNRPVVSIAVGDVKDYTGKYSQNEGNAITQGGALMVYSALGKLGSMVRVQERFDTRIAELELAYADRRQLGDGRTHSVDAGKPSVPWVPYFGGTILRSDYYIVGGITEVNYNIQSGGFDASVNLVGGKRRTYSMSIGVDLRIIDTQTLVVLKTVSMQKQIKGDEVGVGVYRFFGSDLLDLTVGSKSQEPLQLGVRTTIEQSVLELVGAISGVDAGGCVTEALEHRRSASNDQPSPQPGTPPEPPATPVAAAEPLPVQNAAPAPGAAPLPQNNGAAAQAAALELAFESGSTAMTPQALAQIENLMTQGGTGKGVTLKLLARDTENFPPLQTRELTNQRIRTLSEMLTSRGRQVSRISVAWRPDPTDTSVRHEGAGYQLIATMTINQ